MGESSASNSGSPDCQSASGTAVGAAAFSDSSALFDSPCCVVGWNGGGRWIGTARRIPFLLALHEDRRKRLAHFVQGQRRAMLQRQVDGRLIVALQQQVNRRVHGGHQQQRSQKKKNCQAETEKTVHHALSR